MGTLKPAPEKYEPTTSIEGALSDLLVGAFLPCIPVVLVSTLLLTLIFYHRVDLDPGWQLLWAPTTGNISDTSILDAALQFKTSGGDAAYYIRFNPALLAAIASWTSKIIPFLTSSSMAVIAFFAGRRILNATRYDKPGQLPTPHQISILINLLNGAGVRPLWDTFLYRWQNHEHLVQPIPIAFGALGFIVIITLLIGAADTWFAAATKPMNVELLTRHLTPVGSYGRVFDPSMCKEDKWEQRPCPFNYSAQCEYPCSIADWNYTAGATSSLKEGINEAQQAAETLLGNSYINVIQHTSNDGDKPLDNSQRYYYLGDIKSGKDLDFLANTTAISTQCEVITQNCEINTTDSVFLCPGGYRSPSFTYSGEVGVDPAAATGPTNMSMVGIQFFTDAGLQEPVGYGSQTSKLFSAQNPIHFLTWSKGFPPIDPTSQTFASMMKGKYLQVDSSGDNVFILNCSATIYKTTYAWVNGTILHANRQQGFYPVPAPSIYGAIFSAPFAINSALSHLALQNAAALAAYRTTPQDLANKFADEFSAAAVALTAGIMTPAANMLEQSRNNTELLTRVPKIPLYFLVGLKALYALASLVVAGLAVAFTGPSEAQEVKERLTVEGLAVGFFEPGVRQERAVRKVRQLFSEHHDRKERGGARGKGVGEEAGTRKVGIKQTANGGWVWVASGAVQKAWKGLGIGGGEHAGADAGAADRKEPGKESKELGS
ncbi:MAG: hypothetical protein Q9160_005154 [Pyrenula sp. 1 TL-2023]